MQYEKLPGTRGKGKSVNSRRNHGDERNRGDRDISLTPSRVYGVWRYAFVRVTQTSMNCPVCNAKATHSDAWVVCPREDDAREE
jgi:hypothetical protein